MEHVKALLDEGAHVRPSVGGEVVDRSEVRVAIGALMEEVEGRVNDELETDAGEGAP
jgi:hypothetical protein